VILPDGTVDRPDLAGSGDPVDAFVAELEAAVESVASGKPSPMLSGDLARQALRTCHAEVLSATAGGVVPLDG
jgi:hypothetical protein